MNEFVILEGNALPVIRDVVNRFKVSHPKLKIIESRNINGYTTFDYGSNSTFPPIVDWDTALLRECRGLILSRNDGRVIVRRFHKFFNVNEREETFVSNIDFTDATYSEKMDGSLVSPVLLDNNKLVWMTRKEECDGIERALTQESIDYARLCCSHNITPLFEWIQKGKTPGVITYDNDRLVLLALRDNVTGRYNRLDKFDTTGIEVVKEYGCVEFYNELEKEIIDDIDREGVVISLPSGTKYKLKTLWHAYVMKALKFGGNKFFLPEFLKLRPILSGVPFERIWIAALLNDDDVVSMSLTLLNIESESKNLYDFIQAVDDSVRLLEDDLKVWYNEVSIDIGDNRQVTKHLESFGWPEWITTRLSNGLDIHEELIRFLVQLAKDKNFDIIEGLLDIGWDGMSAKTNDMIDVVYNKADPGVADHIISTYLPKKIANMLGIKDVCNNTIINIPRGYQHSEGKIKGLWEKFIKNDIWDLRIDLQPCKKDGDIAHFGTHDHALFLVQFGLIGNPDTHRSGSFAGIQVPTNQDVSFLDIKNAFEKSFSTNHLIKIHKKNTRKKIYRVYCDLDGVLVDFEKGVYDAT